MPDDVASPLVPKQEDQSKASSPSSIESIVDIDAEGEAETQTSPQQNAPVQKRKGGRKPIYATSEERKQRNRQAQAAFRERRTEYIKQLETTIKRQEDSLQSLQQNHRSAADECLMLRYKNSLLERILLEKGIDVQTELKRKEIVPASRAPPPLPRPTSIQRPASSRHRHMQRLSSGSISAVSKNGPAFGSPQLKASPASQLSSPSMSKSPTFANPSGTVLGQTNFQVAQQPPPIQPHHGQRALQPHPPRSSTYPTLANAATQPGLQAIAPNLRNDHRPGHWPSPFQTHNEQLEQEYVSNVDMMDDTHDTPDEIYGGPGPYPQHFGHQSQFASSTAQGIPMTLAATDDGLVSPNGQAGYGQGLPDPSDPMLDADPFGLTASMHFPTPFSFNESSMRK